MQRNHQSSVKKWFLMWKGHLIGHLELQTWKLSLTWNHHSYNLINYKLFEEQRFCPPHLCTSLDVWHIVGNQEILTWFEVLINIKFYRSASYIIGYMSTYTYCMILGNLFFLHLLFPTEENEELDSRISAVPSSSESLNEDQQPMSQWGEDWMSGRYSYLLWGLN